jgi:hypothetical protein
MTTTLGGGGLRDVREELGVDERCDDEEEMAGDKKFSCSWDVVAGTTTGSMMVVAWLAVSSGPTQGGGRSVQCCRRGKKARALLTSFDRW